MKDSYSLKTLLMPREPIRASLGVNVPGLAYGRFSGDPKWIWVTPEVLCPTGPTAAPRMQTEENVGDLSNSVRIKDISSFQRIVWISRVLGVRTLDLAILFRVQASSQVSPFCGNDIGPRWFNCVAALCPSPNTAAALRGTAIASRTPGWHSDCGTAP